jgi:ABC-type antimicrobial peptide transport system permease subunit
MNGSLKMLLRTLSRNKLFSIINVIGLSVGLAVALLIFMLVYNELSFDRSFPDYKRIYRVNSVFQDHRLGQSSALSPAGLAVLVRESVPGVETVVRLRRQGYAIKTDTWSADMSYILVDPDFFSLFPTPVLYGSFEEALSRPDGVAVSEVQADKMFGSEGDHTGKTFLIGANPVEVRAVFRDFPENVTVSRRTVFVPLPPIYDDPRSQKYVGFETYIRLDEQADPAQITARLEEIAADVFKDEGYTFSLQPLKDIRLHSAGVPGSMIISSTGDLTQVRIFSVLAIVILLVVCINYMNLSTAQAQKRLREIGLNKILGAQRSTIVVRSYLESAILTLVAFAIAFGLFYALLPDFSTLMGGLLSVGMIGDPKFLLGLAVIFVATVLLSASYSAWYLSGFPPALAVKKGGTTYKVLRQVLSVAQFAVAIVLITWVIVIKTQTGYIFTKDLGFDDPKQLYGMWTRTGRASDDSFENELRRQSSIVETSLVSNFPSRDKITLKRNPSDEGAEMTYVFSDEHITDLLGLRVIAGRPLPPPLDPQQDTILTAMLNRRAVAALDLTPEEAVGQIVHMENQPVLVGGVVEDFNFENLYTPIAPHAFINMPGGRYYQLIRITEGDLEEKSAAYKQIFDETYPNDLYDLASLSEIMGRSYDGERRTQQLLIPFTILAIFMACMGVFALTAFLVEQRTKEIGIRRVLGSSVGGILGLFAKTYLKLLGIALLIAIPAGVFVCNNYLSTFAYHIGLSWWMFAAAAGITLLLVLIAVIAPTFKAANADPVKNLQYE